MITAPENSPLHPANVDAASITGHLLADLVGLDELPADDRFGLLDRAAKPGFGRWLDAAARARGCTRPVRLRGEVLTVSASTGAVLERFSTDTLPDNVLYKPCGTRIASLCPACATTYRYDTYQLIKAGLAGGKGVPETVALHPAVFVTLTAPSFGTVHTRVVRNDKPQPCRARRDRPVCVHGKAMSCNAVHAETDHRLGQPLCLDCYDHNHQVVWNHLVAKLWDRTMLAVRRQIGATPKGWVKLRYAKVAEYQRRGVVHLHALLRLDANLPGDPNTIAPPPFGIGPDGGQVPLYTAAMLKAAVAVAAASTALTTAPHPDQPAGWVLRWGKQVDVKVVRTGLPGEALTEQHVAGYLAKYATKATEITGVNAGRVTAASMDAYADPARHTNRLITACWNLGAADGWIGLRRWAHMLGFGGHFATKSRRYSTTMGALRAARRPQHRDGATVHAIGPGDAVDVADTADDSTVLVINHWQHVGNGWRTAGDAALAAMAADAARQRRPHTTRPSDT